MPLTSSAPGERLHATLTRLRRLSELAGDLITGRYPHFVYGGPLRSREVPVFVMHAAEPEPFEAMLEYLASNRYQTLTADELECFIRGELTGIPERAVALTFDDGLASLWAVAYPLLKKYGFRATAFLIPGKIREGSVYRPSLDDVWSGRASVLELRGRNRSDEPLASWREIETMHASGVIEFESHTLNHALIFTSPTLVGFVNPRLLERAHPFELAFAHLHESGEDGERAPPPLGTPVYATSSRMSAMPRFLDDAGLRDACIAYVANNGGEAFFRTAGWRRVLRDIVANYVRRCGTSARYETADEQRRAILTELTQSKALIEERLPGKQVRHLSYPWASGSNLAVALSREAGYRTNHWGRIDKRLINRPGDDPYRVSRMRSDFLHLLPGDRRDRLGRVIWRNVRRGMHHGSLYLSH